MDSEKAVSSHQSMSRKKRTSSKKKLTPLNKLKSFPSAGNVKPSLTTKLSVNDLLSKTLVRSATIQPSDTIMVSSNRLKISTDIQKEFDEVDSQLSPGRQYSHRSYGSDSLDGSEYTFGSRLTQRELLHEITSRAQKRLGPPSFVTPMDELHPTSLSWNRKEPLRSSRSNKPQVNIIGCLHPPELILAQADLRSRQRHEIMQARQKICEEKVKAIDEAIQYKFTRAERYALLLQMKQRQVAWMKFVKISSFISNLSVEVRKHIKTGSNFQHTIRAAIIIRQACKRFMRRHLLHKFQFKFLVLFRKREFIFRMQMRIQRKKNAVLRIKTFLTEYKNHHRMNVVVHKYLTGVRKVQRNIRDFIACKHSKISTLAILWSRLEKQYVKQMLEKRKLAKRSTGKISANNDEYADMDQQTIIDMKNQAKLWDRIDSKMEDRIKSLKATGVIVKDNEEDLAEKFMLPPKRRWQALMDMLHFLRKEFYHSQRAVIRKKMDSEAAFSESHALDLLKGRNEDIARIVLEKFDKKLVSMRYKPFMLFSSINHKLIMDRIMHAHAINETWAIKMNDFSNFSTKYAKRKSKEKSVAAAALEAGLAADRLAGVSIKENVGSERTENGTDDGADDDIGFTKV